MIIFKFILTSIILLMASFNVNASMNLEMYEKLKNSQAVDKITFIGAIVETMGDTMMSINVHLLSLGQSEIYCQPHKMDINRDNYVKILEKEILAYKENKELHVKMAEMGRHPEEMPIEMILLDGLIKTFPCPNK